MSGGGLANRCDEGTGPREFQCNKSTKSGDQNSKKPLQALTQSLIYFYIYITLYHQRLFKGEHWDGRIVFNQIPH